MSESDYATPGGWRARMTRPLTPAEHRRIRIFLGLIPVLGWICAVWTTYAFQMSAPGRLDRLGHIKGHDFVHFYMIGEIGRDRATPDLYDGEAHWSRTDRLVPEYEVRYMPIHPPQVAMFFAPLASLPYLLALTIWLVGSIAIYAMCCYLVWATLPSLRDHTAIVVLSALALPALYGLVAAGQTSAFALLWFTLAYLALRAGKPWFTGMLLGMLAYKPTLVIVFPIVFLFDRQWRVLAGAVLVAVAQYAIGGAYFGWPVLLEWVNAMRIGVEAIGHLEAQPWHMHSLRALFANSLPWPAFAAALQLLASLWAIWYAVRAWRSEEPLSVRYSVLLLSTILVSPHVYTYELVILVPVYFQVLCMALEGGPGSRWLWAALYASVYLPGLSLMAAASYVQWSVLAMVWLMVLLGRVNVWQPASVRVALAEGES